MTMVVVLNKRHYYEKASSLLNHMQEHLFCRSKLSGESIVTRCWEFKIRYTVKFYTCMYVHSKIL